MRIVPVDEENLPEAGAVHAASWRESHCTICSAAFIAQHTAQRQTEYLRKEIESGKQVFMLMDEKPVGVVSVHGNLIENLYVLPACWGKGYGSALLEYAQRQCCGVPALSVLSSNTQARAFYEKRGYAYTGETRRLAEGLYELDMQRLTISVR